MKNILLQDTDFDISLKLIVNQIESSKKVLEFGPSTGYFTRFLKEELNCQVTIIEIDPQAAKLAGKYAEKTVVCDIETLTWYNELQNEIFDYIIFADVLEHLKDPWETLRKASSLLKYDGKIIISIPNIGHNSVMIDLWNNYFRYEEAGILDDTHLRFFGIKNLDDLFHNTGLLRVRTEPVILNYKNKRFSRIDKDIPLILKLFLNFRKFGNVFQIVICAQKEQFVLGNNILHSDLLIK